MKIAIDAGPLDRPASGIHRYTQSLLAALARVDAENEYLLLGLHPGSDAAGFGARFHERRSRGRLRARAGFVAFRDGADLVHGTNYVAPFRARIPSVVTVFDLSVRLLPETHPPGPGPGVSLGPRGLRPSAGGGHGVWGPGRACAQFGPRRVLRRRQPDGRGPGGRLPGPGGRYPGRAPRAPGPADGAGCATRASPGGLTAPGS